jgi:hypothetical protein
MGSLPMMFDPVEQRGRRLPLEPHERVREAIYHWMDQEPGTVAEQSAWKQVRRACQAWLKDSRHRP